MPDSLFSVFIEHLLHAGHRAGAGDVGERGRPGGPPLIELEGDGKEGSRFGTEMVRMP